MSPLDHDGPPTVAGLIADRTRRLGDRPLLTCYDDVTGGRTELSYATLDNWAAKLANLFVEEFGLHPGAALGLDLDGHWTTGAVLLAAWKVGAAAHHGASPAAVALTCCHERHVDGYGDHPLLVVGDGLAADPTVPLSLGSGQLVLAEEAHVFADDFDESHVTADTPALATGDGVVDHRGLLQRARAWRDRCGGSERVGLAVPLDDPLSAELLVAAMLAGGGIVCARSDDQTPRWDRLTTERATAVVGPAPVLAAAGDPPSDLTAVPITVDHAR